MSSTVDLHRLLQGRPPSCSRLPMATDHAESNGLHERFGLTSNIEREADGRPMLEADEELFSTFANVGLLLGGSSQGDGTLFVSTRSAKFAPSPACHRRFSFES